MTKFNRDELEQTGDRVVKEWLKKCEKMRLNYVEQNLLTNLIADALNDVQRRVISANKE